MGLTMTDDEYLDLDRKVWCVLHGVAALAVAGFSVWLIWRPGVQILLKIGFCVPAGIRIFLDLRECLRLRRHGARVRRAGYELDATARARGLRTKDPSD